MRDFSGLGETLHPTIPIRKKASEDAHNLGAAPASSDQRKPRTEIPKKTRAGQGLEEKVQSKCSLRKEESWQSQSE